MNLFEKLKEIEDFRRRQGRMHSLPVILLIVVMAYMSGYFGIRSVGDFIKRNKRELIELFKPKKGKLPSHQTVARVLTNIDFNKFADIFFQWAKNYTKIDVGDWLSIDGKAIGGTVTNAHNNLQKFTALVSVFNSKRKQVISLGEVGDKNSEIPLVKTLIKTLDLEGVVFTMDALHCQKETTKIVIESKNDYVIGVKGNQKLLLAQIKKTPKIAKL